MRQGRTLLVAIAASLLVGACTGDDPAGDAPATGDVGTATDPATDDPTNESTASSPGEPGEDPTRASAPTVPPDASAAPITTFPVVEVPETGIPGLDSDDSFCAAWSRFGGSWQVIQVAANFAPDPAVVPAMEVVAAPVVTAAYDAMFAAWPAELDAERDDVADGYFGPLDRRARVALDALVAAGADAEQLNAIGTAWEAALAARRPDDPTVTPTLPDDLWALVDVAAADLDGRLVGFVDDPTMRITVATPETDAYLATACPDQGVLTGAEVDG